jgi:hypothetical protein
MEYLILAINMNWVCLPAVQLLPAACPPYKTLAGGYNFGRRVGRRG